MAEVLSITAQGDDEQRDVATRELLTAAGAEFSSSGYSFLDERRNMAWTCDEFDMEKLGPELTALGWEWGTHYET